MRYEVTREEDGKTTIRTYDDRRKAFRAYDNCLYRYKNAEVMLCDLEEGEILRHRAFVGKNRVAVNRHLAYNA